MIRKSTIDTAMVIQVGVLGLVFALAIWSFFYSVEVARKNHAWLSECAKVTHGSIEREPIGETIYHDSKGNPTSSSVNFQYYVRTRNGKRIDLRQPYEADD